MTREEKLYSMTMVNLVAVADKLGIKIDKKGAKSKAVEKILAAEAENAKSANAEKLVPMPGAEKLAELKKEVDEDTCADGRKYSEIGKEIAKEAKEKAKKAKSEKKPVEKKAKKVVEKLDVLAITEELAKKFKADYKCSRDGIGIFVDDKRVLDFWKRTNKVRVYISDADAKFDKIAKSSFVINLSDNPSKSARLNKSFYVAIADVEKLFSSYFAKKN